MEENNELQDGGQELPQHTEKPKNKTPLFIAIAVVLIGVIIFFIWKKNQLEAEREWQEKEIVKTYIKLDSLSSELDEKIQIIEELGGDIDTLNALKAQLEIDKKQLLIRGKGDRRKINQLNDKVAGYKELLLLKDKEIEQLKEVNVQLTEENTTLKVEKIELAQSIKQLEENREELVGKVAHASRLELVRMEVFAINKNGKERKGLFKSRHIDQLKVQFTVTDNAIAPIEGKELLLRIIAPDGNTLFDVTRGSGSFTFGGRELFYTAKQEILYDRKSQLVTYLYEKGSEYNKGQHKVEVYTDDYLMGSGSFTVK